MNGDPNAESAGGPGNVLKHGMKLIRTAVVLFFAAAVAYLIYQVLLSLNTGYRTVLAIPHTENEGVELKGMVIREETVIRNPGGAPFALLVGQGERVSKDQPVAAVYKTDEEVQRYTIAEQLQNRIKMLEFYEQSARTTSDISAINKNIAEQIRSLSEKSSEGHFSNLQYETDQIYSGIYARIVSLSGTSPIHTMKQILAEQYREIGSKKAGKTYRSTQSGYFCTVVDGWEELLKYGDMQSMTTEGFLRVLEEQLRMPEENITGKLITDYEWGFAAVLDEESAKTLLKGSQYTLILSGREIPATLCKKGEVFDGSVFVFFQSSYNITEVSVMRKRSATVVIRRIEGYKVPKAALRVTDGVTGVFVIEGSTVEFKKVDLVLEKSNYYIVTSDGKKSSLKIYDEIILNHKGVYSGMIIKN